LFTKKQLEKYLGQLIIFGINKLPSLERYWKQEDYVFTYKGKEHGLSKTKWFEINTHIDFDESFFLKYLNETFQNAVETLGYDVVVDKTRFAAHHEDCPYIQFDKDKSAKWAIEFVTIAIEDHYLFAIEGPNYPVEKGGETKINLMKKMLENSLDSTKIHTIIADSNFFTKDSVDYLIQSGNYFILAARSKNDLKMWKPLNKTTFDGETRCVKWNDCLYTATDNGKKVDLITNLYEVKEASSTTKNKGRSVLESYEEKKHQVEHFNALLANYLYTHSHKNWKGNLFTHFVYLIFTNAYILYKRTVKKPMSHCEFLEDLSYSFLKRK
jgi:hypothetical protein